MTQHEEQSKDTQLRCALEELEHLRGRFIELGGRFIELKRRFEEKIQYHHTGAMQSMAESVNGETCTKECLKMLLEVAEMEEPVQRAAQDDPRACEHCTHCEPAENVDDYGCTCPVLRQVFPEYHTSFYVSGAVSCMQVRATVMHSRCSHWQPKEPAHA